jgi:ATP-dependent protease La (LON) substrate-binding domain
MPASRWNSNILEMLNWLIEENDASGFDELFLRPIVPHVKQKEESADEESQNVYADDGQIPSVLPILPLRGVVVYPQTAVPLTIGQARSIRLVDDVMASDRFGSFSRSGFGSPRTGRFVFNRNSGYGPSNVQSSRWIDPPGRPRFSSL